ncbi:transcriptional regulator [Clostridium polyendosporum]|uniref:Stage 0 sporulation protein A homolog n=1 Tax=Clostridium polyendosporum TaxID=69208 RepID=A0A919VGN7_9CLOT|nr:ANTAR domain-containing protein [Clostridium polyendosporum]GIM29372.1 transcriptional regulator [Clostridium polyendosporum]
MLNNYRILLGSSTLKAGGQIKSLLLQRGFNVDGICTSGSMLIRKCRLTRPELVIINYELTDTNGAEVAKILSGEAISKVILLCSSAQYNLISNWTEKMGIVCMQKPIKPSGFLNLVNQVFQQITESRKASKTSKESNGRSIQQKLIIDKAKMLLMKAYNLEENEAYRKIQKDSMDKKLPMLEVAKSILKLYG